MSGRLSQRDTWQWSAPGHHWSQHTVSCLLSTLATFQQRTLRCSVWCLGVLWHRNKLQKHFYIFCAKLIVFCWQWESQFMFPETPRIFGIWTSQSLPWHTLLNIRISGLLIFDTFTRLRVTRDTSCHQTWPLLHKNIYHLCEKIVLPVTISWGFCSVSVLST